MIGAFPLPIHGMAAVNAAVRDRLRASGANVRVIDIAAPTLDRTLIQRMKRLPRVFRGWLRLATMRQTRNATLYMSLSGGCGQIYELGFLMLARFKRIRCVLHHHSFAYLDRPNPITALLLRLAGKDTTQVVLSRGMGKRLIDCYDFQCDFLAMSNAAFLLEHETHQQKWLETSCILKKIGFLSNLSEEKGVFDFFDLVRAMVESGLDIEAKLAGPFQDGETERKVHACLSTLPQVDYLGPVYGEGKRKFYKGIDVLVFPTRYRNEAEPLVVLEALQEGVPVIAYGRGVIPEYIDERCGYVVDIDEEFTKATLPILKQWITKPDELHAMRENASSRFSEIKFEADISWKRLETFLLGDM